jgi:hypothetical protein
MRIDINPLCFNINISHQSTKYKPKFFSSVPGLLEISLEAKEVSWDRSVGIAQVSDMEAWAKFLL